MRFKLDGHWWKVKIQRPPDREVLDGCCDYSTRTIYLKPKAVRSDLLGIVAHEVLHATIPTTDEDHILESERLICAVTSWAAKHNGGKISIGSHLAVE